MNNEQEKRIFHGSAIGHQLLWPTGFFFHIFCICHLKSFSLKFFLEESHLQTLPGHHKNMNHELSLVICKKCMGISKITLLAGTLIVLCAISRGHLCHSVVCIWCFKWQVIPFSHRKVAHIPKASGTQNVRHNFFGIIVAIKAG